MAAELLGAFRANQDSDRGNLSAKIRMAKTRLDELEKYLEDVANAGNHSEAADIQYGAIPEQRAVIKELEAQKAAADLYATGQHHNAMGTDVVITDHINEVLSRWTDREALGGLSAVAMHYTISRDDTASDHARQQCLLGGWAEKTRWQRSPLSRFEQGESATGIDRRFGKVTKQTTSEDDLVENSERTIILERERYRPERTIVSTRSRARAYGNSPVVTRYHDYSHNGDEHVYGSYTSEDEDEYDYSSSVSSMIPHDSLYIRRSVPGSQTYDVPTPPPVPASFIPSPPPASTPSSPVFSDGSEYEYNRRQHRSRRHKTPSPEQLPAGYKPWPERAVPVPPQTVYAPTDGEESPPTSRQHRKRSNSGSAAPIILTRQSSYSSSAYFPKVKTARYEDVQYNNIPHRYREEYTAYA